MTHCTKHRLAALGAALLLMLLSGCQAGGGGGVLVLPDTTDPVPTTKTTWQELLTDAMNDKRTDGKTFLHNAANDETAANVLAHVKKCSGDNAVSAEEILKEDKKTGCAVDAPDIRQILGLSAADKSREVGYAIVPQEFVEGTTVVWSKAAEAELARALIKKHCAVSIDPEHKDLPDRVGFAMGKVEEKMFVIAWLE